MPPAVSCMLERFAAFMDRQQGLFLLLHLP
jgi:hypothetical protein